MKAALLGIVLSLAAAAAVAQRNLDPVMADAFMRGYLGKWTSEGCDNPTASYVVSTTRSATELVVEFRTQSRLLATNVILLDSVRYLGAIDGLNRFGYRVESVVSGQSNLSFDVMLETDSLSRRRTFQSVRVSDGQALIRDGKLSDGSAMPFLVKCEQAR